MINQKTIYRAMIGWQAGIIVGMLGAMVTMVILPLNIWIKIFSVIGLISASLGTIYSLWQTWLQYKSYLAVTKDSSIEEIQKEIKKLKEEIK